MAGLEENGPEPTTSCADPQGDPFLHTRFAIPTRPATFLRRERLVRHLDQALRTPLTMISGAAGAGKTMLAADWAAREDRSVAWLTNDATAQGCGMFWAYFLQALSASDVPPPAEVGSPAEASRVDQTLLTRLAAGLSDRDRPVIVVLDEYDRVTAPEIAEQLQFVLHHAGRGMRLILVTRTEPLLPLHRYRAVGDMTEIRAAELAFTPEEAAALLELHGLRVPVSAARALVERTRGWAAGLRLCALAAQESPDPETYLKEFEVDRTTVADFLLAEVLKRQTPEAQDLLLRVSVLDRFGPELANALTGRTDAESILDGLHRENAFVEYLGHARYRLHPLFGEILHAHLRMRSPGLEPELHRRAATWLRDSGSLAETLGHGAAAGDWEFTAGALVDDLAIGQLFTGLRSDHLAELFSGMGPEATSPATDLVRAARELARSDLDHGLAHLRHAEQSLAGEERTPAGDGPPGLAAARLSCALLETLAARLTGSPARAETAAETAGELQQEVPAQLLDAHPELAALLSTHLGSTRLWAGRFEDAHDALNTAVACSGGASTALPREESLGHLALIDYLNGWPGRAERKALAAITETERFSLREESGSGIELLVLAAVAVDRNELDQAQALLDAAADSQHAMRDPVTRAGRALATSRLLLARGETHAALEAAEPAVPAGVVSPWSEAHKALVTSAAHLAEGRPGTAADLLQGVPGDQPACVVGAARAQLAAGRAVEALGLLDQVRPEGRIGPAVTVRASLVRARAADLAGDSATVRRLVAHALHEARRERLRRPFLEAGPWIRPLLGTVPLRGLAAGWLTPGPPPCDAPRARPGDQPPAPVVEELSGREHDVLERLAQMMSTEEIAADLYVSVNTVKTHLKSVYRKLAVNRRHDAVHRARELRLL
ncbi:LuxR family maltose regulon positive regulatory protein [Streptomyces phaeochromogenes]|uniref:LuxR C-terminal-related transcriptional regulator n=1 Tax=Streptomyces phaeochromogenes TaxID=1923 RepID=UPI00278D8E9E|nr:LuxR C-terminal-related transcriptional regulator [Streptomyces phaeochromogenes]MDQ0954602.1 LuxR family maltose regulon positive regulatory protein [Streptomyces phaeochromogenes]